MTDPKIASKKIKLRRIFFDSEMSTTRFLRHKNLKRAVLRPPVTELMMKTNPDSQTSAQISCPYNSANGFPFIAEIVTKIPKTVDATNWITCINKLSLNNGQSKFRFRFQSKLDFW